MKNVCVHFLVTNKVNVRSKIWTQTFYYEKCLCSFFETNKENVRLKK